MAVAFVPAALAAAGALAATPPAKLPSPATKTDAPAVPQPPLAVVDKYCITCHNSRAKIGGVAFDALDRKALGHDAAIWEEAIRRLRGHYMPPSSMPQPSETDRQA